MTDRRKAVSRGFSLIEGVIVMVVLTIVAVLSVLIVRADTRRERLSHAHSDVTRLARSLARLRDDTGSTAAGCLGSPRWLMSAAGPTACGGPDLPLCSTSASGARCWGGPYLREPAPLVDSWATRFRYEYDTVTHAITVISAGPDTVFEDEDDIASTR